MTLPAVMEKLRTPMGRKLFRYSMASVVAVIVSTVCLVIFKGVFGWGAVLSSTLATSIAAVPSYEMNRKWAWGKTGRSHLVKEVLPFWGLAVIGWVCSTISVRFMDDYAHHHHFSHLTETASVAVVYVAAFGVLWIVKFVIFNELLFVHRHHEPVPSRTEGSSALRA